jgi:hypothetical protein
VRQENVDNFAFPATDRRDTLADSRTAADLPNSDNDAARAITTDIRIKAAVICCDILYRRVAADHFHSDVYSVSFSFPQRILNVAETNPAVTIAPFRRCLICCLNKI